MVTTLFKLSPNPKNKNKENKGKAHNSVLSMKLAFIPEGNNSWVEAFVLKKKARN